MIAVARLATIVWAYILIACFHRMCMVMIVCMHYVAMVMMVLMTFMTGSTEESAYLMRCKIGYDICA